MNGKGKQFVAHGRKVVMAFPGGAGYGDPSNDRRQVKRDLALGYISAETPQKTTTFSVPDIEEVERRRTRETHMTTQTPQNTSYDVGHSVGP